MKLRLLTTLLALAAILCTTMVSCQKKTDSSSTDVVGADGSSGDSDIKVGEIETLDKILNFRLYTEKSGDKYYAIVGFSKSQQQTLTIPTTFKDLPVRVIADGAFKDCSEITSLSIPEGITVIGKLAFDNCDKITEVIIPNSVISLGERAFSDCDTLASVSIGNGLHTVSESAFYSCDKLTAIQFGSAVRVIGHAAFANCYALEEVVFPRELTTLEERAFRYCTKLKKLQIFDQLTKIGENAFFGCTELTGTELDGANYLGNDENPYLILRSISDKTVTEYTLHADTRYVLQSVFADCSNLTTVALPSTVKLLSENAFDRCTALTTIQFGGTTEEWNAICKINLWDNQTGNYTVVCNNGSLAKKG